MELTYERIATNGVMLNVGLAGPEGAPLLVLLHGFPECSHAWRHQVPTLVDAGFRVAVPEQRGYDGSDKPGAVDAYGIDTLTGDVVGLLDALGAPSAGIVGHDWGGAVAWWMAQQHPARVTRFAVLNCPHPAVMARALRTNPAQLLRSWYMLAFQLPGVPEAVLRRDDFAALGNYIRNGARPGAFTDADIEAYKRAWRPTGAITAMINWYRAALRVRASRPLSRMIAPPALLIWGRQDPALSNTLAEPSIARCADGRIDWLPDSSHWVQADMPERVNALLLEFFEPVLPAATRVPLHAVPERRPEPARERELEPA
jgi:pimeloyl-ACP methyl ester carboxylesterase